MSSALRSGLNAFLLSDHRLGEEDKRRRPLVAGRTQALRRPISGSAACAYVVLATVLSAAVLTDHALLARGQGHRKFRPDGFFAKPGFRVHNASQIQVVSVPASPTRPAPCGCNRWVIALALCILLGSSVCIFCFASDHIRAAGVIAGTVAVVYVFLCAFITLCRYFLTTSETQLRFAPLAFSFLILAEMRFSAYCSEEAERENRKGRCCECGDCLFYLAMGLFSWIFTLPFAITLVVMMEPRAIPFTLQVLTFLYGFAVDFNGERERAVPWNATKARLTATPPIDDVLSVNAGCAVTALSAASGLILLKFMVTGSHTTDFTPGLVMYFAFHATWAAVFINSKLVHLRKRQNNLPLFSYFKVRDSIAVPMFQTLPYLVGASVVMRGGDFGDAANMICAASLWSPLFVPTTLYDLVAPSLSWARASWTTVMACVLPSIPCRIAQTLASCVAHYPWILAVLGSTAGTYASRSGKPPSFSYCCSVAIVLVCGGVPWIAAWMSRQTLQGFAGLTHVPEALPTWDSNRMAKATSELRRDFYIPLMALQCALLLVVVGALYAGFIQLPRRLGIVQNPDDAMSSTAVVVSHQTTSARSGNVFKIFLVYHVSHNLVLFLGISFAVRNALMNVATGVDWELWLLWLVWLSIVYAVTCLLKYSWHIGQRLPSPLLNVVMQIAPGLGNDIHLFKDWLFIGLCTHQAHCTEGLRGFIAHLLAGSSFAFLFLPLSSLLNDETARESFIASHWPVVVDRPTVASSPSPEVESAPGKLPDSTNGVVKYFLFAHAAFPSHSSKLLEEMVSQTTTAKFVLVLQNEVPQAVNAVNFLMIFGGSYFVIVAVLMSCVKIFAIPVIRDSLPLLLPTFGTPLALSRFTLQSLRHRLSTQAFRGGQTALHIAATWGGARGVSASRQLLSEGAEGIDVEDAKKRTALVIAAHNGDIQFARVLVEFGADQVKALNYALKESDTVTLKFLIDALGFSHTIDDMLDKAISAGSRECAGFFIDRGANLERRGHHGLTPLLTAVRAQEWSMAEYLVRKRADMEAQYQNGLTPLAWVAMMCEQAASRKLAAIDAPLAVHDLKRCKGLHGGVSFVARLLELKASHSSVSGTDSLLGAAKSGVPLLLRVEGGRNVGIDGEYSLVPGAPRIDGMPFWQHSTEPVWIYSQPERGVWHIGGATNRMAHACEKHEGRMPNSHSFECKTANRGWVQYIRVEKL